LSNRLRPPSFDSIHHPHKITSFDFHPTEPCVAYGDEAGVIRVNYCLPRVDPMDSDAKPQVQPNKQTRIDRYDWHTSPISALQFSPDGFYLLSGGQEVRPRCFKAFLRLFSFSFSSFSFIIRL
jgi:NET1-associated nuclear protein 1 (U3 small nucleolar RNA-associated protein 17)